MPIDVAAAKRRRRISALGAAAIGVAAALVVVLAVSVLRRDSSTVSMHDAMQTALDSSDSRQVTLRSEDGSVQTEAVLDSQGHGFVAADSLPQLPSDRTYQLWGLIDGRAISLGVLGHRPGVASFSAEGNLTGVVDHQRDRRWRAHRRQPRRSAQRERRPERTSAARQLRHRPLDAGEVGLALLAARPVDAVHRQPGEPGAHVHGASPAPSG